MARPSPRQLATVPHHFIGHISITEEYSAAQFEKDAQEKLNQLFKKYDAVIMTGGSGLFIDAVLKGFDETSPADIRIREQLNLRYKEQGLPSLTEQLKQLDPETYNTIDLNNHRRVMRALEICMVTGKPASSLKTKQPKQRDFIPVKIVLNTGREALYERINRRVDIMMQEGLLKEAEGLLPQRSLNALQTVGYRELFDYFDGKTTLENATELIKQHTRNYAKRQLTWFKKDKEYQWFEPADEQGIISYTDKIISL